jgi:hypothetical protein
MLIVAKKHLIVTKNYYISLIDIAKYHDIENHFWMLPQKWINETDAIGMISKSGRYGGGTLKDNYRADLHGFYFFRENHDNLKNKTCLK